MTLLLEICGKGIRVRGRLIRIARLEGKNTSFWTTRRLCSAA